MSSGPQVVILGGGFAGLETAFTLRQHLGDRVGLTVVSDEPDFLFKPNSIYIPFGGREDKLHIPLARPMRRRDITLHQGQVAEVDDDAHQVSLADGTQLGYDFLVVATGAAMRPEEVPGLAENARTIWTPQQMRELGDDLRWVLEEARRGLRRKVLFLVPPNNKCAGPLYEIAFMLDRWLRRHDVRGDVDISWTTFESSYIQAFGPRLHEVVTTEFAARDIQGRTGAVVTKVLPDEVVYADGSTEEYDLLISFPPYVSAVSYPGLPSDDRGFLQTDLATRQVPNHPGVYAPGDAGDFPVKQAFLAFLQADAVADDIAAKVASKRLRRFRPFTPTSMCVMEMFDKATFAQVPLELTGDPARPVQVDSNAPEQYRVGVSPLWRPGKKSLGIYLPLQFRAGRPFHGGRPWQAMEIALRGLSHTLATGAEDAVATDAKDAAATPSN
ncbi:MAG: NAD(P)/FAD-dependent oxidoreductase [Acidimicrobiales bacterium]